MITEIGIVAGEVWHCLDEHRGTARLSDITAAIGRSRELALMSAGWLAREGHVVLQQEGQDYLVTLRQPS